LIEGAGLFNIAAYFLTDYQVYALFYLLTGLLFAFNCATPSHFLKNTHLNTNEKKILDKNKAF
jgi:hypothetical protein